MMTADDDAMRAIGGGAWGGGTAAEHWIGCPLLDPQHQVLGAIVIQSYDAEHVYSVEDQALFAQIANHVSSALQGMQSMDRLERAVQERTALLAHEVAERRRAENIQRALYEIANLSAQAADAATLYARCTHHQRAGAGAELPDGPIPSGQQGNQRSLFCRREGRAGAREALHYGIGMSPTSCAPPGADARPGRAKR
jgi:GAF domain-containing protein